ncbi:MAG: hypothetical protein JXJ22_16405 [Bacteroidales bacterium]|nr:hypothetical protein [Bacteroidales bacterium]
MKKIFFLVIIFVIVLFGILFITKYQSYKRKCQNFYDINIEFIIGSVVNNYLKSYGYPKSINDLSAFINKTIAYSEFIDKEYSLNLFIDSINNQLIIYDDGFDNKNDFLKKNIFYNKISFPQSLIYKGDVLIYKRSIDSIWFSSLEKYIFLNSEGKAILMNDTIVYDTLLIRLEKYYQNNEYQKLDPFFDRISLYSPRSKRILIGGIKNCDNKFEIRIIEHNIDSFELLENFTNCYLNFLNNYNFNDSIYNFYILLPFYEKSYFAPQLGVE